MGTFLICSKRGRGSSASPVLRATMTRVASPLLGIRNVPHYATEADCAPARAGARVMERISPSELWRMAMTG